MRIASVDVLPRQLRLSEPFAVTSGARDLIEVVLVRLTTDDGTVGWGEATPDEAVTGESVAESARVLRDVLAPALAGRDDTDQGLTDRVVAGLAPDAPAARAAVDIAVHDLCARRDGVPLWQHLRRLRRMGPEDGPTGPLTVSRVVSMAAPTEMASTARRHVDAGFTTVKVKVGDARRWELDVERVAAVRAAVGPDVGIKVDVNQGWETADVAVAALERIAASRPLWAEQPVGRLDVDGLAEVRRRVPGVAIMADESVRVPGDVERLAEAGAADLVNLKLMRLGGIGSTFDAADAAAGAGLGVQIGTMLESSVGSAAGLHVAAALGAAPGVDLVGVEMGGPLLLAEDVGDLAGCYDGETVTLPPTPGLIPHIAI